jgi:cyclopropane fatty-acyl-phospholipid synthase-like methyltransferase
MKFLKPIYLILQRVPLLGPLALAPMAWLKRLWFTGSRKYWETRYAAGGTSGLGSYGEVAEFKAKVLNDFVRKHAIETVIEFGCGDGNQLSLADYPAYLGLDISKSAIQLCIARFREDTTKSFFQYDSDCFHDSRRLFNADLTMSLDVIYHLVEDQIFYAYMRHLFSASNRFVIIFSSDTNANAAHLAPHVKNRNFSEWIMKNISGWRLMERIPNIFADKDDLYADAVANFFIYEKTNHPETTG